MRRLWVLLAAGVMVVSGCALQPQPDGTVTLRPWTYADSEAAIHAAFDPYGVEVYTKARSVAVCESGLWPYAGWFPTPSVYKGIFQLGPHIVAVQAYGDGNVFNPYVNAYAARDLWVSRGDWSAWPNCG